MTRPAGFDWRTDIALVGGFAAKEVIVATLGTAYSSATSIPKIPRRWRSRSATTALDARHRLGSAGVCAAVRALSGDCRRYPAGDGFVGLACVQYGIQHADRVRGAVAVRHVTMLFL